MFSGHEHAGPASRFPLPRTVTRHYRSNRFRHRRRSIAVRYPGPEEPCGQDRTRGLRPAVAEAEHGFALGGIACKDHWSVACKRSSPMSNSDQDWAITQSTNSRPSATSAIGPCAERGSAAAHICHQQRLTSRHENPHYLGDPHPLPAFGSPARQARVCWIRDRDPVPDFNGSGRNRSAVIRSPPRMVR